MSVFYEKRPPGPYYHTLTSKIAHFIFLKDVFVFFLDNVGSSYEDILASFNSNGKDGLRLRSGNTVRSVLKTLSGSSLPALRVSPPSPNQSFGTDDVTENAESVLRNEGKHQLLEDEHLLDLYIQGVLGDALGASMGMRPCHSVSTCTMPDRTRLKSHGWLIHMFSNQIPNQFKINIFLSLFISLNYLRQCKQVISQCV